MEIKQSPIQRPTIKDVARLAGVSPMTVSRVVNTPDEVGESKRRAVMDAIDRLRYVPNKAAASLQRVKSMMVALLLPDLSHSLYHDLYVGLNSVLESAGYLVLIGESHFDAAREYALAQSMLSWQPAGFVFHDSLRDSRTTAMLASSGVPMCLLSDPDFASNRMVVGYSSFRIGAAVARYLFRLGRRRIGFVRSTHAYTRATEKMLEGARSVLPDYLDREIVMIGVPRPSPLSFDDGASIVRSLENEQADLSCDALVFANDVPAIGAVLECQRRGIRVPDQLAIVGFGDTELARLISPTLTTVAIDSQEIGRAAAHNLLDYMGGASVRHRVEEMGFRLVARETA